MRRGLACALLLALLAGCALPAAPHLEVPATPARTLAAPPRLAPGEWWRIALEDVLLGRSYTLTRVVAEANATSALVGVLAGEDDALDEVLLVHAPGIGEIDARNLSWLVHGVPSGFVRFPLEAGASWPLVFDGATGTATVLDVDAARGLAHLRYDGPLPLAGTATYDAQAGTLTEMGLAGYVRVRVVAHGFGETRPLLVPVGARLSVHDRVAGLLGPDRAPAPPPETWTPEGSPDRITYALFVLDILQGSGPATPGACEESATLPDGSAKDLLRAPGETGNRFLTGRLDAPRGAWSFTHLAGGACAVGTEIVAYQVRRGTAAATGET